MISLDYIMSDLIQSEFKNRDLSAPFTYFSIFASFSINPKVMLTELCDDHTSAVIDKTAILRKYDMSTTILFCRHNSVLFWKRKDS